MHINGNGLDSFPDHPPLVTRMLAEAGFDCGLIGKLHLASAYQRIEPRVNDGYRSWEYSTATRPATIGRRGTAMPIGCGRRGYRRAHGHYVVDKRIIWIIIAMRIAILFNLMPEAKI